MKIRSGISRRLLDRLEQHTPQFFYRVQIQALADLAAGSFGCKRIRIGEKSPAKAVRKYARFTVSCMETQPGDPERLFKDAYALGAKVRRISGLSDPRDLQKLVFLLYRNIDIWMSGELPGEIHVSSCYFSRFYTPHQCALMSCVDSGIISGIFGGGELKFSQRITEGCDCCIARFGENFCKEEKCHV